jgi:hypothetical protein
MRSIIGDDQTVFTFATLKSTATKATATNRGAADPAGGEEEGDDVGTVLGSALEMTLEDDDVSYCLTSDDGDDDDDDDDDEDDDDEGEDDDEEEEDEDEDDDDGVTEGGEKAADECEAAAAGTRSSSPVVGASSSSSSSSPSMPPSSLFDPMPGGGGDGGGDGDGVSHPQSRDARTNDHHYYYDEEEDLFDKLVGEIEELMEEDLEAAAMASLIGGPGAETAGGESSGASSGGGCGGGGSNNRGVAVGAIGRGPPSRGPGGNTGAVMGTVQQRAITTPGVSTKKKKSTTTVVTTPPPCSHGGGGGRGADGDDATSSGGGGGAIEVPAVSKDQMARLRGIMARHHQLLLQQATLSVRAAFVQKVRKDGAGPSKVSSNVNNTSPTTTANAGRRPVAKKGEYSTLPESRLDTRSLTFCLNPYAGSGCSYPNDFFGGETPEELSESLDGAVGMLQDLEQVIVCVFLVRDETN